MSFFIADAWAEASPQAGQDPLMGFLPLIILFVVFWFLLIRPQSKRAKEHRNMVSNLSKGDEIVTSGGLLGRITDLDDNYITLEISSGVQIRIERQAVGKLVPKGTF